MNRNFCFAYSRKRNLNIKMHANFAKVGNEEYFILLMQRCSAANAIKCRPLREIYNNIYNNNITYNT